VPERFIADQQSGAAPLSIGACGKCRIVEDRVAKKPDPNSASAKRALMESISKNELTLGEAVRGMRKLTGMGQKAYAERIIGISTRILAELERNEGNPTVETLNKVGRPFGLVVGFVTKNRR
jgi:DNA-binding XRE family transcriptional regulator